MKEPGRDGSVFLLGYFRIICGENGKGIKE